jgi:predicted metal-dependent HD superfamily phosphohydrolase
MNTPYTYHMYLQLIDRIKPIDNTLPGLIHEHDSLRRDQRLYNDFITLVLKYKESQRFYHIWEHIETGWNLLKKLKKMFEFPDAAEFAWLYHDCIYIPHSKVNEAASSAEAEFACIRYGFSDDFIDQVSSNIVDDQRHDNNLFHDIDFSILAAPGSQYRLYTRNIRREYFFVSISQREDFLKTMLHKPIFRTQYFIDKYEKRAQENIERELERIKHEKEKAYR